MAYLDTRPITTTLPITTTFQLLRRVGGSLAYTSACNAKKYILCIQTGLAEVTQHSGVVVDSNTHHDMVAVMREHTPDIYQKHAPDSFPRLFWEQQQQAYLR